MKLLETTFSEEKKTDATLTNLAQSELNQHAQAAWRTVWDPRHAEFINLPPFGLATYSSPYPSCIPAMGR